MVKVNKNKNLKKKSNSMSYNKQISESGTLLKNFVILIIIMIIVVVGGYFLSKVIVDGRNNNADNTIAGEIDYDIVTIGTMLNRSYDEYYVMIYNSEDSDAIYYSSLITKYQKVKDSLKIYFCDLSNSLNSKYVASDKATNIKDKNIENLRFGPITLIKIKEGKISKAYEKIEEIKKALQ